MNTECRDVTVETSVGWNVILVGGERCVIFIVYFRPMDDFVVVVCVVCVGVVRSDLCEIWNCISGGV